jgi:hypothetical protein
MHTDRSMLSRSSTPLFRADHFGSLPSAGFAAGAFGAAALAAAEDY